MIQGTTPTFRLAINGRNVDLTQATNVYVTITQGQQSITMTGESLEIKQNMVSFWLPQEWSLLLSGNATAEMQCNWTYTDPETGAVKRAATKPQTIQVGKQLLKRVIS